MKSLFLFFLILLPAVAQFKVADSHGKSLPADQFVNPIGEGADPWVIRDPNADRYLWCLSDGNRGISIHSSKKLTSFGEKHTVWRAPEVGPYSREVWAPELHFLDGKWVIYFAASDGNNANHLAYALQSKTADPLGEYDLHGPFQTGDTLEKNLWAIDMTPLDYGGKRYAIWSGWDGPGTDRQYLYIAEMKSPTQLASRRVRLCANDDYPWERTEPGDRGRGLNEGPQVLKSATRTFLTYSCGASWLASYKLGLLELTGTDPLDPASWKKHPKPVFQSTSKTYGVGHSCFVRSPDASEWWHVFHAKRDPRPGWRRAIFIQPFQFFRNGLPQLGAPIRAGKAQRLPRGESTSQLKLPYRSDLRSDHSYFGHHQFYQITKDGLRLGSPPAEAINDYRSGEKILLGAAIPENFTASVTIDFSGNRKSSDAGILFRATAPSVGYDAHRGYFVGFKPSKNALIFGKMDGSRWKEIARKKLSLDPAKKIRLTVSAVGSQFTIQLDGKTIFVRRDSDYASGTIGLRVVDTSATFSDLQITASKE